MPGTSERVNNQAHPLIYSALTTRRSSYPEWVFLKSSSLEGCILHLPVLLRRADLGNEGYTALLLAHRLLIVPPMLNNVANSLEMFFVRGPFLHYPTIGLCYHTVVKVLFIASDPVNMIHLFDAHERIAVSAMKSMLSCHGRHEQTLNAACEAGKQFIRNRWGNSLRYCEFDDVILEIYLFLDQVSYNLLFLLFFYFVTYV